MPVIKDIELNVFASPILETLKAYINFRTEKKNPQVKNPLVVFSILLKGLGDAKVAIMLSETTESAPKTERYFYKASSITGSIAASIRRGLRETLTQNFDETVVSRVELFLTKYEAFYKSNKEHGRKRVRYVLDK
ncbi:hypothetical protein PsorP6_006587 [Peronosclerospora sorghi]|uniref:Uncharacterized protein n=1 Tax=Peronosclerospora sorghi TaxID=230839 RepID=A0ACC0W7D0_9STRA|nr:hypothetical protein PsorP6_006587 [Peronosclerospora sorghi]